MKRAQPGQQHSKSQFIRALASPYMEGRNNKKFCVYLLIILSFKQRRV